jgi:hypothetical protein
MAKKRGGGGPSPGQAQRDAHEAPAPPTPSAKHNAGAGAQPGWTPKPPPSPDYTPKPVTQPPTGRREETLKIAREHASQDIVKRASLFPQGTVEKHPVTVASLIKSSVSTEDLRTIAANLDRAWQVVSARNASVIEHHDPDSAFHPQGYQRAIQLKLAGEWEALSPEEKQHVLEGALDEGLFGGNPIAQAAEGAQTIIGAPLKAGGWTLDHLGLGVVRDEVFDPAFHVAGEVVATGGRVFSGAAAAALGVYGTLRGHGEDVDWNAVKYFWDLNRDDPLTTEIFSLSGWDINDPKNREARENLNLFAGLAGQVAFARFSATTVELMKLPYEQGGYFKAESFVDHRILNRGIFNKTAAMFEKTPPEARTGQLMATSRHIDVRLADILREAYEKGTDRPTRIAAMKDAYVNYAKDTPAKLKGSLRSVESALKDDPENPVLQSRRLELRTRLENQAEKGYEVEWPRYTELRGAAKGVPAPDTALGRAFNAIYERNQDSPYAGSYRVMKFTDNVRDRFPSWSPWDPKAPVDWLDQNARNWGRLLRSARVPAETVATRLGEMLEWTKPGADVSMYAEWVKRVSQDIVDNARFLDAKAKDGILSTLRNDELYSERAVVPERIVDEQGKVTVRNRRLLEGPTQENEFARSSRAPSADDIKNLNSTLRQVERKMGGKSWEKYSKLKDQGMAGWRAATIVPRGAAINLAIQTSESLAAFFEGTGLGIGRRFSQRVGGYLLGHVPLSDAAASAVADRLGFVNEGAARIWYEQVRQNPEQLGQMIWDASVEEGKRVYAPATQFNQRFLEGAFDDADPLVRQHFRDLAWEVEHLGDSHMVRTLMRRGVSETADLMLGEGETVSLPLQGVYKTLRSRILQEYGAEGTEAPSLSGSQLNRIVRETDTTGGATFDPVTSKFVRKGDTGFGVETGSESKVLTPEEWANARVRNAAIREVVAQHPELAQEGMHLGTWRDPATGEVYIGPSEVATTAEEALRKGALREQQAVYDFAKGEDLPVPPGYDIGGGLDITPMDRAALEKFLTLKERQAQVLSGGSPEVLDLIGKGRTSGVKLPDELQVEQLNEELGQLRLNLLDPETPAGQRISLIDRKAELLERLGVEEGGRHVSLTDTNTVANLIRDKAKAGEYELPEGRWTQVTRKGWMDEDGNMQGALSRFTRATYGAMKFMNGDIARKGFFQSNYVKWFDRLRASGYDVAHADSMAAARAAFEVRDWMHDIGNKSSFQRALRNEVPFLHAWERVAYQWFVKLPNKMGFGITPLGWAVESNILHSFEGLLRSTGVMRHEKGVDGEYHDIVYLPNPANLLDWLPGVTMHGPDEIRIDDPGHLLIPTRLLEGELPGLAPQASFALNRAAEAFGGKFKALSDQLTMDGAFTLQFPGATIATKVWEAVTGDVPPWSIGKSEKYQEYVMARAHDVAWRYAYTELTKAGDRPPDPAKFEGDRAGYIEARDEYWAALKTTANEYFHGIALTYALSSVASPVSFRPTTEEEHAWQEFLKDNGIEGERTQEDYDLIDKYLGEHPESFAYNVSYWDRASKWDDVGDGYAEFRDAIATGKVKVLNAHDYRTALGLSQEWDYLHEAQRQALNAAGLTNWYDMDAAEQLRNWGKYLEATGPGWENFDNYLRDNPDAKRLADEFMSPSERIYNKVQEIERDRYDILRAGGDPDAQEQRLYDNLASSTTYGTTNTDHALWYRNVVMNKYYDAVNPLYAKIDELENSGAPGASDAQSRVYDQIRKVNDQWPVVKGEDGAVYPPPEEFAYSKLTKQEQREKREKWASIPPAWLTEYALTQTYGEQNGRTRKYLHDERAVQRYFDQKTANISPSSTEYDNWVKWREKSFDILAERSGTQELRKLEKAPAIGRLAAAGLTPDTESMDWIVAQSAAIANRLRANDLSVWGASQDAQYYRGWLESYIERMRNPESHLYDSEVDRFFTQQARKTGITYDPALYRYVLFGIKGSFEIEYDFSAENQAANGGSN